MTNAWSADQLRTIENAHELEITGARQDGSLRPWTPIWAVHVGGDVYVRTWVRRTTGWYGRAVRTGRARVRVPDLETAVVVEDVGNGDSTLRTAIDEAYSKKYGHGGSVARMTEDETAATTLRLSPSSIAIPPPSRAASPR